MILIIWFIIRWYWIAVAPLQSSNTDHIVLSKWTTMKFTILSDLYFFFLMFEVRKWMPSTFSTNWIYQLQFVKLSRFIQLKWDSCFSSWKGERETVSETIFFVFNDFSWPFFKNFNPKKLLKCCIEFLGNLLNFSTGQRFLKHIQNKFFSVGKAMPTLMPSICILEICRAIFIKYLS